MLKSLRIPSALIISFFWSATLLQADEQLLDGVRPFMCDGEAFVLLETDRGWAISTDPAAEVTSTDNGWRYEDPVSGGVWYLKQVKRNAWKIEVLSEEGYLQADCIDMLNIVDQVTTIIKPRLSENIIQTQLALNTTASDLEAAKALNKQLRSELENISATHANEITQAQAVLSTQISYLKMHHKDEISKLEAELEKANGQLTESTEALGGLESYRKEQLVNLFAGDDVASIKSYLKDFSSAAPELRREQAKLLVSLLPKRSNNYCFEQLGEGKLDFDDPNFCETSLLNVIQSALKD